MIVFDALAYRRLNVLRGLRIASIPLDTNYGEGSDVRLLIGMLSEGDDVGQVVSSHTVYEVQHGAAHAS